MEFESALGIPPRVVLPERRASNKGLICQHELSPAGAAKDPNSFLLLEMKCGCSKNHFSHLISLCT